VISPGLSAPGTPVWWLSYVMRSPNVISSNGLDEHTVAREHLATFTRNCQHSTGKILFYRTSGGIKHGHSTSLCHPLSLLLSHAIFMYLDEASNASSQNRGIRCLANDPAVVHRDFRMPSR